MAAASKINSIEHACRLPEDCLALIFDSVQERNNCRLVCRRWLAVEATYRRKLTIKIYEEDDLIHIPSLLSRYSAVSDLALVTMEFRPYKSMDPVSLSNLTRLHLENWILTHDAMTALVSNCPHLSSLSCKKTKIDDNHVIAAFVDGCPLLQSISLRCIWMDDVNLGEHIVPKTSTSLHSIDLGQPISPMATLLAPLLACSPNLAILKFDSVIEKPNIPLCQSASLVKIDLCGTTMTNHTLFAISRCTNLQILHISLVDLSTNAGLLAVVNNCKQLRKIHIDGSDMVMVMDEAIVIVLTCCRNLRELYLFYIKVTSRSLRLIGSNCRNLQHLALWGIHAFGDAELSSITANCISLKKLTLVGCSVSDHGFEALANGCPNLGVVTWTPPHQFHMAALLKIKEGTMDSQISQVRG